MKLLTTQKNTLYDIIEEANISPSHFSFEYVKNDVIIRCKSLDNFAFKIEPTPSSNIFKTTYVPIEDRFTSGSTICTGFREIFSAFKKWISYVQPELNCDDKWDAMEYQMSLINFSTDTIPPHIKFSFSEYQDLCQKMSEIKNQLASINSLHTKLDEINTRLDHMTNMAQSLSKKDWTTMMMGTIISMIVNQIVPPNAGETIWSAIKELFTSIHLLQ